MAIVDDGNIIHKIRMSNLMLLMWDAEIDDISQTIQYSVLVRTRQQRVGALKLHAFARIYLQ
jgi:hypothetical protein